MKRQTSTGSWLGAAVVVLIVAVAGVYLARQSMQPDAPVDSATPATSATAADAAPPRIEHPVEQASVPASASTAPLPALDDSDNSIAAAFARLAGGADLQGLLVPQRIVERVVATVDALPRRGLASLLLPWHSPKGAFVTAEAEGTLVASDDNAARYTPYMQIVQGVDPAEAAAWYVYAYPLFQQAYRDLGYPKGYFNDRLIAVIDHLLAAPDLAQPAALVRSKTYYVYLDPALESLSAGQKLMIRVGPANEAMLKAKLRGFRASVTKAAPAE